MNDGHIDKGVLYNKVEELSEEKLEGIQVLTAGFPCPDISISGKMAGLSGQRSSLFRFVVKAAVLSKSRLLVLENVAHLISDGMKAVFMEILVYLLQLGFKDIRWG